MLEVRPPPAPGLPNLRRPLFLHAVLSTPVDRTGACRFLPHSCGLPRLTGGSASTTLLSRPAQASLALRPAGSLARLRRTFVPRLRVIPGLVESHVHSIGASVEEKYRPYAELHSIAEVQSWIRNRATQ